MIPGRASRVGLAVGLWLALLLPACGTPARAPASAKAPPAAQPAAVAAATSELDRVLPIDARVRVGTLANGLTYYVVRHRKPEQRAQLWLAVDAGSVLEDDDQRGLAHFVEHMAFNGTARFGKQSLTDYLEKVGMEFGADVNAYTSFDETVYMLQVPTDDASILDTGLDVLHEWASRVSFDPGEVDLERGVVLEEWRLGRDAWMRILDKQYPIIFHGSRYGERLPIGKPEVLRTAPRDALVRFYRDWYRPDLMAVIAVGDFDAEAIEAGIRQRFGDLAKPSSARPRTAPTVPREHEPLITIESDPEMTESQITIYDKIGTRSNRTVGDYRRVVLEWLYHDMLGHRLEELARDPGAPLVWAYSSTHALARTADVFQRGAMAKEGRVEEALALLFEEVLRVERHGFTATELARGKRRMLRDFQKSARERDKRDAGDLAAEVLRHFLEDEQMPGIDAELALVERFLPAIDPAEINHLARQWGGRDGRVIAISGPAGGKLPTRERIATRVREIEGRSVTPWRDDLADQPLMATPPAAGRITGERRIDEIGVTEWTLSNGVKVVWKPTDFQNDEVQLTAFSPGGHSRVGDADFASARFAGDIVADSGAGDHDAITLDKLLAGRLVEVATWVDELEEGVSGKASPEDLETFFQLVHLRMTAPRRDPRAFAAWKAQQVELVRNRRKSPELAFFDDMVAFLGQNHLRVRPVTVETLDKVDLDRALAIYRERFADAADFTFVLVGNLDAAALRPLVETYLASLPSTHRKETWRDVGVRRPRGKRTRTARAGTEPKSFVYLTLHAPQRWSKEAERDLQVLEKVLDLRLREVLREEMGGVYSAMVWAELERRPVQERTLTLFFGCAPENVDRLRAAAMAEIAALGRTPVSEDTLVKVRELFRRAHEVELKDNGHWLRELEDAYRWAEDPREIPDLAPLLARVTAPTLRAAARRYLTLDHHVLGVLRPAR